MCSYLMMLALIYLMPSSVDSYTQRIRHIIESVNHESVAPDRLALEEIQ